MAQPIIPGNVPCPFLRCGQYKEHNKRAQTNAPKRIRQHQAGFSYMGILMLIVIVGIGLAGAGLVWHIQLQRLKEQQLLFAGDAIRKAICSYSASNSNAISEYPRLLELLLLDERKITPKRHLRRLYQDPMGKQEDWALIMQNERVIGVHSKSKLKPIKTTGFDAENEGFNDAKTYQDWQFVCTPGGG